MSDCVPTRQRSTVVGVSCTRIIRSAEPGYKRLIACLSTQWTLFKPSYHGLIIGWQQDNVIVG